MAPHPRPAAPSVLRGILLMLLATFAFMAMQGAIRHMTAELPPFVIAFYRNFVSLLILTPWIVGLGPRAWRSARPGVHLLRGGINVVSMLCQFTALSMTPLADVTALSFTAPLFATLGAVVFLGEKMRLRRWSALVVGFVGALVILRPGIIEIGPGPILTIVASALWATALLIIKVQARNDSSLTITLYMALVMSPLSLLAALPFWVWPSWGQLGWLVGIAALGTLGQVALAQSFREADATAVMPFDFLKLVWAAAIGWAAFGEMPDGWTWTGGAIIFASTLYIAWREAKTKRDGRVQAR